MGQRITELETKKNEIHMNYVNQSISAEVYSWMIGLICRNSRVSICLWCVSWRFFALARLKFSYGFACSYFVMLCVCLFVFSFSFSND